MAIIHGIAGSTQYLLNGLKIIGERKPATLEEINHFYKNYNEILAETAAALEKQLDAKILSLSEDEIRLNSQLQESIAQHKVEVETDISNLKTKIDSATNIFTKWGYKLRYWIALSFRSKNITPPYTGLMKDLQGVQNKKAMLIRDKPIRVKNECDRIVANYTFLTENESFLIGAIGEEQVIRVLSGLSDEYHVLNDVNLRFQPAVYWKERGEYIKTSQIDHVVVGPTGVFLLETKNWKVSDIEIKSDKLLFQVKRSSLALWYFLKNNRSQNGMPKIRNVIVSIQGSNTDEKLDTYIDLVAPNWLCDYISNRKNILSADAVGRLVDVIPHSRSDDRYKNIPY